MRACPAAARVFEEADDALGFKLSDLCFNGPEDALKLTENTQPALLTVSTAANAVECAAANGKLALAGTGSDLINYARVR